MRCFACETKVFINNVLILSDDEKARLKDQQGGQCDG